MTQMTIKQIRIGMDMTQEQVAELLEISTPSYQRKESGVGRFYFDEVRKICKAANVSLDLVKA